MNYGPLLFLAAFFAMSSSWLTYVLVPQIQVGRLQPTNSVPAGVTYPVARPGLARTGLDVYRANGCASCHSQQAVQTATVCDVLLTEAGTNSAKVIAALTQPGPAPSSRVAFGQEEVQGMLKRLPVVVLQALTKDAADAEAKALSATGAKAQVIVRPVGPDIAAGWALRRSVAEDFLYDYPVMLGDQRLGPDLSNIGARQPDANWHLLHLYSPRLKTEGSAMPPYRFLFETRKIGRNPSTEALQLSGKSAPPAGWEVVPKPEAQALVAYLVSLRANVPLFNAPVSMVATAGTNAPQR
jgi:cbb3-type cytochrome oxidase cytochrome c subunit